MIKPYKLAHLHSAPPSACDVAFEIATEMHWCALLFYFKQIRSLHLISTESGLNEINRAVKSNMYNVQNSRNQTNAHYRGEIRETAISWGYTENTKGWINQTCLCWFSKDSRYTRVPQSLAIRMIHVLRSKENNTRQVNELYRCKIQERIKLTQPEIM